MIGARAVVVGIVLLALAGCSGSDVVVEDPVTDEMTAGEAAGRTPIPTPAPEVAGQLLIELAQIDEGLRHDRSIDRARGTCSEILNDGLAGDELLTRVELRFEGGTVPELSPEQVARVLEVVERLVCIEQ